MLLSVSVSRVLPVRQSIEVSAKAAHEVWPLAWVLVQPRHRDDTICAEGAKILPQLAPRAQHPRPVHESELNRPDDAFGTSPLFVSIANVEPDPVEDCRALLIKWRNILWKGPRRSGQGQWIGHLRLGLRR